MLHPIFRPLASIARASTRAMPIFLGSVNVVYYFERIAYISRETKLIETKSASCDR